MDKQEYPLVSIVIPVYNSEEYLSDTLDSVLNQTYTNWEVILVDDDSQDNTHKLIEKYTEMFANIKSFFMSTNQGPAICRNKGVKEANGKFIAFLDSDDIWAKNKLTKQVNFMITNNYSFTATGYGKMDIAGKILDQKIEIKQKMHYKDILKNPPGNLTVMYDSETLGKVYISNVRKRNDYLMWLTAIKKANVLYGLNEVLGYHRLRKNSVSSNKISLIKFHWMIYRKHENLTLFYSVYLILYIIIKKTLRLGNVFH